MFVFYFGILADDTPPVGVAAFAAAAISGGDPIRTGITGVAYDIRTALLPFLFIFNHELLLIDVTIGKAIFVFIIAVIAMLLFAAATQGFFIPRRRWYESAALLLVAFTLFRPGYWLDQIEEPFVHRPGTEVVKEAGRLPEGGMLRMLVSGPDFDHPDRMASLTLVAPMGAPGEGEQRLSDAGLMVGDNPDAPQGTVALEEPMAGTPYFTKMQMFDFYGDRPVVIERVELEAERMPKEVFYVPGLALLGLIIVMQRSRRKATLAAV